MAVKISSDPVKIIDRQIPRLRTRYQVIVEISLFQETFQQILFFLLKMDKSLYIQRPILYIASCSKVYEIIQSTSVTYETTENFIGRFYKVTLAL